MQNITSFDFIWSFFKFLKIFQLLYFISWMILQLLGLTKISFYIMKLQNYEQCKNQDSLPS